MEISDEKRPSEEIIRVISPPHCARGPQGCEKCREAAKIKKICLLKIFFDHGQIARPMIKLDRDGSWSFYEYDILQIFQDKNKAIEYAKKHNITDIVIS
jgi:hypothetical protein